MKLLVSARCEKQIEKAARYIAKNSVTQAEIFFDTFDKMKNAIELMPGIGTKHINGMRKIQLGKFRYMIYYREKKRKTIVLGIRHTSRGGIFRG
jgi:plasmid stabilization system protein ParE